MFDRNIIWFFGRKHEYVAFEKDYWFVGLFTKFRTVLFMFREHRRLNSIYYLRVHLNVERTYIHMFIIVYTYIYIYKYAINFNFRYIYEHLLCVRFV